MNALRKTAVQHIGDVEERVGGGDRDARDGHQLPLTQPAKLDCRHAEADP
jgi:hypothetical protein